MRGRRRSSAIGPDRARSGANSTGSCAIFLRPREAALRAPGGRAYRAPWRPAQTRRQSNPPKGFEPGGGELGIAHRMLDILVTEVGIDSRCYFGAREVLGQHSPGRGKIRRKACFFRKCRFRNPPSRPRCHRTRAYRAPAIRDFLQLRCLLPCLRCPLLGVKRTQLCRVGLLLMTHLRLGDDQPWANLPLPVRWPRPIRCYSEPRGGYGTAFKDQDR
jgi:hypothetical protein